MTDSISIQDQHLSSNPEIRDEDISIQRCPRDKKNPYGMFPKKVINDEKLSLLALGLWMRFMSFPEGWSFSFDEFKDEEKEVEAAFQELIEAGYIVKTGAGGVYEPRF